MTIEQINHTGSICDEVFKERVLQDENWGQQNRTPEQYAVILHEEVSQVTKVLGEAQFTASVNACSNRLGNLRKELIQVAAVAVAMVESLDRNELKSSFPFESDPQCSATDIWVFELPTQP